MESKSIGYFASKDGLGPHKSSCIKAQEVSINHECFLAQNNLKIQIRFTDLTIDTKKSWQMLETYNLNAFHSPLEQE